MHKKKLTKEQKLAIDDSVLTCSHVINGTEKYEYIPEGYKEDPDDEVKATESFTCSKCLDMMAKKGSKSVMKFLVLVCRECFIETRVKKK